MNIGPSQSVLHAFGNTVSQTAPTAQTKIPASTQPVERPVANTTQRLDAAPRSEASARPDSEHRPPAAEQRSARGTKIDVFA